MIVEKCGHGALGVSTVVVALRLLYYVLFSVVLSLFLDFWVQCLVAACFRVLAL